MAFKSYWDENKEVLINQALVDYKENDCPSAGFNIIRYTDKGVLSIKSEFQDLSQKMFMELPSYNETKYVILRLAKLGALEWNGV
jgi:hypothetical protein